MNDFDTANTITIAGAASDGAGRTFKPGDIVGGSYRLKELLGQGGMGYVYLAEHTMFSKDYALKLISSGRLNQSSRSRFEMEGRIIAKLDHPNIVKVHNMGFDNGCPFYVMDVLHGQTLDELIGKQVSLDRWLDIFAGLSAGLAYAHSKQIIHRDIKPSNVALTGDDQHAVPKLLDFGIAKSADANAQQALTLQGEIIGSPLYMSTEQAQGTPVDLRSDIYSLGCTFFECLTGRPPFKGTSALHTLMMHQQEPVPALREYNPSIERAADLDFLLQKMMAKKPEQRYQTMSDVMHDVQRIKRGLSIGKRAATVSLPEPEHIDDHFVGKAKTQPRPSLRVWLGLFTLLVSVIGIASVLTLKPQSKTLAVIKAPPAMPSETDLAANVLGNVSALAFQRENSNKASAIADYREAKSITAKPVRHYGKQQFAVQFPGWSIGQILHDSDAPVEGRDLQYFSDIKSLTLVSGGHDSRQIFNYPEIFKKIDRNLFTGFSINGRCLTDKTAKYDALFEEAMAVENILKAVCAWPRIERVFVAKLMLTTGSTYALNSMRSLKYLTITRCQVDTTAMATMPFLKRLKSIELTEMIDAQPIIAALASSNKLEAAKIRDCNLSKKSFQDICATKTLKHLHIRDRNINDLLPLMPSSSALTSLVVSDARLSAQQLLRLNTAPHLNSITVDANLYSEIERAKLTASNSKLHFFVARP
jgi:serine/threonine protein kinase